MNEKKQSICVLWFRQDLRLADNPALLAAQSSGLKILALYLLDEDNPGSWALGAASRWWLHHSLQQLDRSMDGNLNIFRVEPFAFFDRISEEFNISEVFWNRCYEPWRIKRDTKIKSLLKSKNISVKSFNGSLLYEPHRVSKPDGQPYKVFSAYFKRGCLLSQPAPPMPLAPAQNLSWLSIDHPGLDALNLAPKKSWADGFRAHSQPGEKGAQQRLAAFLHAGLKDYQQGRDVPSTNHVSRLSAHLHFGEISANAVWYAARGVGANKPEFETDLAHFLSELGWREFSYYLLFHNPQLPRKNIKPKFDRFEWEDDPTALKAWQQGQTGIPMVDAGMRELWQTGSMHNRLRMIVASFLIKNLQLHWHHGADWFWDTLLDADLASNSASWQWVAGSGADAAPYFRIFNPVTQGQKFDPQTQYICQYVPELQVLPLKYRHTPWLTPPEIMRKNGFILGRDYPEPIVDLKISRQSALNKFAALKFIEAEPNDCSNQ